MPARRLSLSLLLALAVAVSAASVGSADSLRPAEPEPVPSLAPAQTAALWARLVARPAPRAQAMAACRPLRAVFYAATDWLRLTTKLAASASPCADYYVSIPPVVADKTQPRADQAWRIRALGPRFHALAEIHFATWSRWVASTREQLAHGRGDRARADGGRRVRRRQGRHLGAQRGRLGRPQGGRRGAREPP